MARLSSWKPEYVELAKNFCLLGATDEELAIFFEVSLSTLRSWKRKNEDLRNAIKCGKQAADAKVAKSLYQRAIGFSQTEIDIRIVKGEVIQTTYTKKYASDTTACIFWLKNRQPELWRERRERDITQDVDEQLKLVELERAKFLLEKLKAAETDLETDEDQTEFLAELAKRLPT